MIRQAGEWITVASRAGFLALIVYAAAAYGVTRAPTVPIFANLLLGVFAIRLIGALLSRTMPRVGPGAIALAFLLAAFGWSVVAFGVWGDGAFDSNGLPEWLVDATVFYGTMYPEIVIPAMVLASGLLGGFLLAVDLWNHASWSRALVLTMALTAIGVIGLFYLQRTVGEPFLLRSMEGRHTLNFGTYRYWGNGASFLNLMWPLFFAVGIHLGLRRNKAWAIWIALALVVFAANFFNISKAGNVLALAGAIAFAILVGLRSLRLRESFEFSFSPAVAIASAVPVLAIGISLWFLVPWDRWDRFKSVTLGEIEAFPDLDVDEIKDARLIGYGHFETIAKEAGWQGFGVGSYQGALFDIIDDERLREMPFWVAHQDYFQTVVEWGFFGTGLWGILFGVAGLRLLVRSFAPRQKGDGSARSGYESDAFLTRLERAGKLFAQLPGGDSATLQTAAFTSVILTGLHATVDFPMQVPSLQLYFLIWIALGWKRKRGFYSAKPDWDLGT